MAVRPIPAGYTTVTPYLIVRGAAKAIAFYRDAFGAEEIDRMPLPDGRLAHADFKIGDSHVVLADEMPEMKIVGPDSLGGTSVGLALYVTDCDAVFNKAVAAGAKVERPLGEMKRRMAKAHG